MALLVMMLTGLVGAAVTWRAARHLATTATVRRTNYRGLTVPTAAGISVILGVFVAAGLLGFLRSIAPGSEFLATAATDAVWFVGLAAAFGLLGLWDDIAGREEQRGWGAHLSAVRHGRATAGSIKMVGGVAVAAVAASVHGSSLGRTLAMTAVIALSANLFNLLDVRPGRSGKFFLIAAVVLMIPAGAANPMLAAAAGAVTAFLPIDLRERAMLGDVGSNALGAMIGWAIVGTASLTWLLVALGILIILNLAGDRPGLSRLIASVPPLRALDTAGRVPE